MAYFIFYLLSYLSIYYLSSYLSIYYLSSFLLSILCSILSGSRATSSEDAARGSLFFINAELNFTRKDRKVLFSLRPYVTRTYYAEHCPAIVLLSEQIID